MGQIAKDICRNISLWRFILDISSHAYVMCLLFRREKWLPPADRGRSASQSVKSHKPGQVLCKLCANDKSKGFQEDLTKDRDIEARLQEDGGDNRESCLYFLSFRHSFGGKVCMKSYRLWLETVEIYGLKMYLFSLSFNDNYCSCNFP